MVGDRIVILRTRIGQGMTSLRLGDLASARRLLLTAWREAIRIRAGREICLCTEFLGELQVVAGKHAQARRTLRLCRRQAERLAPEGDLIAELGIREAHLDLCEGRYAEAEARARESIELCLRKGMAWEEAQARRLAGAALALRGELTSAQAELECARDLYERMGESLEIRIVRAWLAWLAARGEGSAPPLHPAQLEQTAEPASEAKAAVDLRSAESEPMSESPRAALRRLRDSSRERAQRTSRAAAAGSDTTKGIVSDGRGSSAEADTTGSIAAADPGLASVPRPPRPTRVVPLHEVWTSLGLITHSVRFTRALEELRQHAEAGSNILILGETGTGKDLLAQGAHRLSNRRGQYVPFNCAGCPASLIESELFGVERGAFTGADRRRPGLIQRAAEGTLFLDEVGDLRPESQGALLRFLDTGEVRSLGSPEIHSVTLGVVAATHRPLDQSLKDHSFRPDLYYRLTQGFVRIPPLRERPEDLEPLITAMWERILGTAAPSWILRPPSLELLQDHPWQGNVRELQHFLQRLQVRSSGDELPLDVLAVLLREGTPWNDDRSPTAEQIRGALGMTNGNRLRAAALLGISRAKLYRLVEKHGVEEAVSRSR